MNPTTRLKPFGDCNYSVNRLPREKRCRSVSSATAAIQKQITMQHKVRVFGPPQVEDMQVCILLLLLAQTTLRHL
jgi:hypothetical protein